MNAGPPSRRPGASRSPAEVTVPVVLALLIVVPAIALLSLWRFADGRATEPEPLPLTPTQEPTGRPAPALSTSLLSWRRMPQLLVSEAQLAALRSQIDDAVASLPPDSCVDVRIDGERVGRHGSDAQLLPASTLKVVTAAVALDTLGADHRFTTTVHGNVGEGGVVSGDLVLVGGGDPLLFTDDYPMGIEPHPVIHPTSLDDLADALVEAGVTSVEGDIVGDGTRYDDEWYHPTWWEEDRGREAGPIDGLVVNRVRGVDGSTPSSDTDPADAAAGELMRLLAARGVDVAGSPRAGQLRDQPPQQLAQIDSAPLGDLVTDVLTNSDDSAAEMLIKEVGVAAGGQGTWAAGIDAATARLESWGVATGGLRYVDGSGLSTDNRMTCGALTTVLDRFGFESKLGQALPVAGETGTLAVELVGSSVQGELAAKTGSLTNLPADAPPPAAKALAGFLPAADESITFALLLNGPTINDPARYQPLWGQLADALDTYPAGPTADELGP